MRNKYSSFYLSDILVVTDNVLMEQLMTPIQTTPNTDDAHMEAIDKHNFEIAWMNEGARRFRNALVEAFQKDEDDG